MKVKLHEFLTHTFEAVEWLASHCGHRNQVGWSVIGSAKCTSELVRKQ